MTTPDLSTSEAIAQARAEAASLLERVTPGEWHYRPWRYDDWGMVRAGDGHIVALARDGGLSSDRDQEEHRDNGTDPYEANARLITAAPATTATLIAALGALATTRQALAELMHAVTPALQRSSPKSEWANAWEIAEALMEGREPRGLIPEETPDVQ